MSLKKEHIELFNLAVENRKVISLPILEALHDIKSADKDSTERIFFDHGGVSVYVAYMFVKLNPRPSHRPRCVDRLENLLKFVNKLSPKARQVAAVQLQEGMTNSNKSNLQKGVEIALKPRNRGRLFRRNEKGVKRAARESRPPTTSCGAEAENSEGNTGSCDPDMSRTPTASLPSTQPNSDEPAQQSPGLAVSPLQHSELQLSQQDISDLRNHSDSQALPSSSSTNNNDHTFSNASVIACKQLFPEYLAGAIKRIPKEGCISVAAVSITFPHGKHEKVFLSIDVMPSKTPHIAWELFGTRLENEGAMRFACTGAVKIFPYPGFTLGCCRIAPISEIFGQQLGNDISAQPLYKQERKNMDDHTRCIWMFVPVAAAECAKIHIMLHPKEGTKVKDLLFPSA